MGIITVWRTSTIAHPKSRTVCRRNQKISKGNLVFILYIDLTCLYSTYKIPKDNFWYASQTKHYDDQKEGPCKMMIRMKQWSVKWHNICPINNCTQFGYETRTCEPKTNMPNYIEKTCSNSWGEYRAFYCNDFDRIFLSSFMFTRFREQNRRVRVHSLDMVRIRYSWTPTHFVLNCGWQLYQPSKIVTNTKHELIKIFITVWCCRQGDIFSIILYCWWSLKAVWLPVSWFQSVRARKRELKKRCQCQI